MNSGRGTSNTISSSTATIFASWAKHLYEISPVNGSALTGRRYFQIPHLKGHPLVGQALKAAEDNGVGLGKVVREAAALAKGNSRGMCAFWIGNRMVLLITRPNEIEQIMKFHDHEIERGWPLKPFGNIFGNRNIFTIPEYTEVQRKEWQNKRNLLRRWVLQEHELKQVVDGMQPIINEHIEKIKKEKKLTLPPFLIALTMDIFARTRLGTKSIIDAAPKISRVINSTMGAAIDPKNRLLQMAADLKKYLCIKKPGPLDVGRDNLMNVFVDLLVTPNQEEIRKSNNILSEIALAAKQRNENNEHLAIKDLTEEDLKADDVLKDGCTTLLAGHETTQSLILFALLSLSDPLYQDKLEKLNQEIMANRPRDGKWQKEDIDKLTYMKMVLKETLRLFAPDSVTPREVMEAICFANIPRCDTKEKYNEAMANRNELEDVWVYPGDLIFFSPLVTHHLESVYDNPEEFRPERWTNDPDPTSNKDPYVYFAFGLGHRDCIGKKFAVAEAALVLVNLIEHFNFKISTSVPRYTTEMRGTTRHVGVVEVDFKEKKCADVVEAEFGEKSRFCN